jgi:hypothetical protein
MNPPPLYQQQEHDEILSTLRGSTTHRASELADQVHVWLQAKAARAAAGQASAAKRSARIRSAIRQAAGLEPLAQGHTLAPLSLQWDGWPGAVADRIDKDPQRFGVRAGEVCDDTIREEWRLLKMEAKTVP